MNNQSHAHQGTSQSGAQSTAGWKEVGIACLLATLVLLSPIVMLFWVMQKGYHDARSAQDELKRTANPDELRAWAWMQIKKHPHGGYMTVPVEELPKTFPQFAQSRGLSLHLDAADVEQGNRDDVLRAILVWGFSSGYSMSVTVWLNPDGSAADIDSPQAWAKGLTTACYGK
ncbi:hypothetical protein [Roseimicrobium sp. ORNL1]|uniref:hypothetical protein n=1 Tax=Roseimicrobium sp. ORNL1 TaxID=2711231 RepID=UPI0013E1D2EA|nr:hypothetical protein [Roseimicrobium sp. ORNL1]QIF03054.1 hypothetical protein G5S37_16500 [Roseimicrobium sp. ORNL1]